MEDGVGRSSDPPLGLFAIPISPDSVFPPVQPSFDSSIRIEAPDWPRFRRAFVWLQRTLSDDFFINRYRQAPVRFVVGVSSVIDLFSLRHSSLEGRLPEGLSKLFAQNVCVYVYPMTPGAMEESLPSALAAGWRWKSQAGLITADQLQAPPPLRHLPDYLLASKFMVPMRPHLTPALQAVHQRLLEVR